MEIKDKKGKQIGPQKPSAHESRVKLGTGETQVKNMCCASIIVGHGPEEENSL